MANKPRKRKPRRRNRGQQQPAPKESPPAPVTPASAPVVVQEPKADVGKDIAADQRDGGGNRIYRLELWQHRFTAALVLFAAVQAGMAFYQWSAMAKQNDIMLDQMRQTDETLELMRTAQRANIVINPPEIQAIAPSAPIKLRYSVKNTGGGNGVIRHMTSAVFNSAPDNDMVDEMSKVAYHSILHGRKHLEMESHGESAIDAVIDNGFTTQQLNDILHGKTVFRLVVALDFTDDVGGRKMVWRCFRYNLEAKAFDADDDHYYDAWVYKTLPADVKPDTGEPGPEP
jgi:hypothetical protein